MLKIWREDLVALMDRREWLFAAVAGLATACKEESAGTRDIPAPSNAVEDPSARFPEGFEGNGSD